MGSWSPPATAKKDTRVRWPGSDVLLGAIQMPVRRPGRSALTTLGLSIGVGAFIAMISFGRGARSSVVSQFETLGSNVLRVQPAYGASSEAPRPLSQTDIDALERSATTLALIVPTGFVSADVTYGGQRSHTSVRGTIPEFAALEQWHLASGGLFDDADGAQRGKVCVIGTTTATQLFGSADPLGQVVTIDARLPCRVIGVLAPHGSAVSGSDLDDRLLLPLATFEAYLGLPHGYFAVDLQPKNRALLEAAKLEVTQILRRSHQLRPDQMDDFRVSSPDDLTHVAEKIGGILTGLLAGIAAVSLLVGGIGIMNIQLVSVAERTHEIGIRGAVGASPGQIMQQFLSEALVLAVLGSGAGVALGVAASFLVANRMHWPQAVSLDVVIGSALFGIAVGTVFGYIPAKRAANLDPIEALRRE
jgi:putative ABC transport system permease protein